MADTPLKYDAIETTGKLITSVDGTEIGKTDFQSLVNMRYTDKDVRSIQGQTDVSTNALTRVVGGVTVTDPLISGFQFVKDAPAAESHLLVQATSGEIYDSQATVPNQGNFSGLAALSGVTPGKFSPAPDGNVVFGNGSDLLIWSGNEGRCSGFVVADTDDTTAPTELYDFTDKIVDNDVTTYAKINLVGVGERYVFVASVRPLQGVKFYVGTANTAYSGGSSLFDGAYYWDGTAWSAVSGAFDNTVTVVGGKFITLGATGKISFDSTVATAKIRYFNNQLAYWYMFKFGATLLSTTTITKCTVDMPIQKPLDLWDGVPRTIAGAWYKDIFQNWQDISYRIYGKDYDGGTYADIRYEPADTTFATCNMSTNVTPDYFCELYIGFTSKMMGMRVSLAPGMPTTYIPSKVNNGFKVYYWNGSAWTLLTVADSTSIFNQDGDIFWNQYIADEEKTSIQTKDLFYYYKITSIDLTHEFSFLCDQITGIPSPETLPTLGNYAFPVMFQNRLVLCNNQSNEANTVLIGGSSTSSIFSGTDTKKLYFGDSPAVVAAAPFFSKFASNYFESLLVCKADSVFVVHGESPSDFTVKKVASMYGCAAPRTLTNCDIGLTGSTAYSESENVIIWQSASAIVMWNGFSITPIHADIEDVFLQTNSYAINPAMMNQSTAFYDDKLHEWHWLWASKGSSVLNNEYVFDVLRKKWFTVSRGGKPIEGGVPVIDSNNNKYVYGLSADGTVKRLENGQTFNGVAITSSYRIADIALAGWLYNTSIRKVRPIFKSKSNTTNKLQVKYYGDTSIAPTKTFQFAVNDSTHRIAQPPVQTMDEGNFNFHSFECSMTTDNEDICFDPVGIGIYYKPIREDMR